MGAANWDSAWKFVQARANELRSKPFTELLSLPEYSQVKAAAELPGYKVFVSRDAMLNGEVAIRVEAFRNYLFGLYSRSVWDGFEKSAEGTVREYKRDQ